MIATTKDIKLCRPLANNIDEGRIAPYIEEAEKIYIIPAITAKLYKAIDEQSEEEREAGKYDDILNAGYYEDGSQYHEGLLTAIAYLAYSRFVLNQGVAVTAFGVVQKAAQYSEPIEEAAIVRLSDDAKQRGITALAGVVAYLKAAGYITTEEARESKNNTKFTRRYKAIGE